MGWSCAAEAAHVTDRWGDQCHAVTGSQNTYVGTDGETYFWETSRREHDDGAITGTVYMHLPNDRCRKAGTFRIDGDGTVTRYPKAWPFPKAGKSSKPAIRTNNVVRSDIPGEAPMFGRVVSLGRAGVVWVKWDGFVNPMKIHHSALTVMY